MDFIDKEINLTLEKDFTPVKEILDSLIKENNLVNANIICFVPHEVSSLVWIWWESWLIDDLRDFLNDNIPEWKYLNHDEPGTPYRYNFFEHMRSKLIGNTSLTLIVKDSQIYMWKYQDLCFYSPVFKNIPNQKIFCRVLKL